jgi:hypothetical protein
MERPKRTNSCGIEQEWVDGREIVDIPIRINLEINNPYTIL